VDEWNGFHGYEEKMIKRYTYYLCLVSFMMSLSILSSAGTSTPNEMASDPQLSEALDKINKLKKELETQKKINQQLTVRLNSLFEKKAKAGESASFDIATLDPSIKPATPESEMDGANTAIEQSLGSRGLVLLPLGSFRITPSATFVQNGSGNTRADSYIAGVNLQAGLPYGMMASINAPYLWQDFSSGSNEGMGDISAAISKKLNNETAMIPSLTATLSYRDNNGKDAFSAVPIGSGFKSTSINFSAFKRFDPLVVYGNFSYSHAFERSMEVTGQNPFASKLIPGDGYGLGMGISLAATPTISLDAGLSYSYYHGLTMEAQNQAAYQFPKSSVAYMNFGANFLLYKNVLLNVYSSAGVTDNAADFIFGAALPYRF
jgi:opacity protein-like surface antigen